MANERGCICRYKAFSPLSIGSLSVTLIGFMLQVKHVMFFQSPFYRVFECNPEFTIDNDKLAESFSPLSIGSLSVTYNKITDMLTLCEGGVNN